MNKLKHLLVGGLATLTIQSHLINNTDVSKTEELTLECSTLPTSLQNILKASIVNAVKNNKYHLESVLQNNQFNEDQLWLLNNLRIDMFDITTGDPLISIAGEVHLTITIYNLSTKRLQCIELMEGVDDAENTARKLAEFGFVVDLDNPVQMEDMDNGVRYYYSVDLDLATFQSATNSEGSIGRVIRNVARLVIEAPFNQDSYVRDFLGDGVIINTASTRLQYSDETP